jgi:putative two-component system response regulator
MATVLVVEDDVTTCKFMRLSLERDEFDVIEAHNGRDALTMLARTDRPVDVVVSDYRLPGLSGLEVIAAARRRDASIPCIMVTGSTELDVAIRAMTNGAVGFLVKPFTAEALRVVVARAMERRRLADEALRLRTVVPMLERFTVLLADVVEARDIETYAHCQRLIAISDRLAEWLGVPARERQNIRLGACLHDIGKIAVPDAILHKPEALTAWEWDIMRRHPEVGAALLEDIEQWREARIVVRHHHERFDGSGYPDGLASTEIPLSSRIVAVADAVDVMAVGRPYQRPRAPEEVVAEVRAHRGRQFDPDVADAFLAMAGIDPAMQHAMYSHDLVHASIMG